MSSSSSQTSAQGLITTESSFEILAESGQSLQANNPFLDNISLFRQSSLDISLIDFFFNKGTNPSFVDLDALNSSSSSSSSSGGFLLLVTLDGGDDEYGNPYEFPEDLQFYFYDEKVDNVENSGIFSAQKISNRNEVIVHFSSAPEPSGSEFSFQLNIEHPELSKVTNVFKFTEKKFYSYSDSTGLRRRNETGRFPPSFITTLHSWISSFWIAYDLDDFSLVPPLVKPPGNENSEFDPFHHARWKVMYELGLLNSLALVMGEPDINGGTGGLGKKPRFGNFLGVSSGVYNCIIEGGLYKSYDTEQTLEDYVAGKGQRDPRSFDCRAFSLAAAMFLKKQLSTVCKANVKLLSNGGPGLKTYHALCIVELQGCAGSSGAIPDCTPECCSGSFIYEPQTQQRYASVDAYCKQNKTLCEQRDKWITGDIDDFPSWDSDWEDYPEERERIKNVICGCLTGTYRTGTTESILQQKCQNGSFKTWFKQNFAYEPGQSSSPVTGIPQILSCKKVSCEKGREGGPTGPLCTQSPDPGTYGGITPYLCETECEEKWDCSNDPLFLCNPVYSLKGKQGEYDSESSCENVCSNDKVCVNNWIVKYNCGTGQWVRLMGGNSTKECLDRERFPTSTDWETLPEDGCNYRSFTQASNACADYSSCSTCMYNAECAPSQVSQFPDPPTSDCCGSWCEMDPNTLEPTGNCISGTQEEWVLAETAKTALSYRFGVPCSPGDCYQKPRSFFLDDDEWKYAGGGKLGEIKKRLKKASPPPRKTWPIKNNVFDQ